jgi:hypothetical protein
VTTRVQQFGGRQSGRSLQGAPFRLLAEATEAIRALEMPTRAQRDALGRAVARIGEAADALSDAIYMDTIDLHEDDR